MDFAEVLDKVVELLQREQRVSYRALKLRFGIDDEYIATLKEELIDAKRLAIDENDKILVWTGASPVSGSEFQVPSSQSLTPSTQPLTPSPKTLDSRLRDSRLTAAERRQLTVMFCDLVGSTALSHRLDPEDLHQLVQAYQQTCAAVITRYEGHIAQYLGDGILVYFGYPAAHEDDAIRAVRTGLEILDQLQHREFSHPLQVRIGIHTGLVVVGEIGSSEKRELLALGETPNIAARVQGQAAPNTLVISGDTYHLVQGFFACNDLGPQELKGLSAPLRLYRVQGAGAAQSRFEVSVQQGLTPLVGREEESELLARRWQRAKAGEGQVGEGLNVLDEAIAVMLKTDQRNYEAELYRLKGELTLQKFQVLESRVGIAHHDGSVAEAGTVGEAHPTEDEEAEACFLKALDIARKQQAKSLELRAATSLARLWHQQGKQAEARALLAPVYQWFTEGFDTKDLQEAKALLDSLGFSV